jgi:hypothetical protein
MDRLRWRIVRVEDRLVRVLQYREHDLEWRDIFTNDIADTRAAAFLPSVNRTPGWSGELPPEVIDLGRYRAQKKRR